MLTHARDERCPDPEAFKEGMRKLVAAARAGERGAFNLAQLRIGDVLLEVVPTARLEPVPILQVGSRKRASQSMCTYMRAS